VRNSENNAVPVKRNGTKNKIRNIQLLREPTELWE